MWKFPLVESWQCSKFWILVHCGFQVFGLGKFNMAKYIPSIISARSQREKPLGHLTVSFHPATWGRSVDLPSWHAGPGSGNGARVRDHSDLPELLPYQWGPKDEATVQSVFGLCCYIQCECLKNACFEWLGLAYNDFSRWEC